MIASDCFLGLQRGGRDIDEQTQYQSLCRGAATFILLGTKELAAEARDLAALFHRDPVSVSQDIDAIVRAEHDKVGGVFQELLK